MGNHILDEMRKAKLLGRTLDTEALLEDLDDCAGVDVKNIPVNCDTCEDRKLCYRLYMQVTV